MERKKHANKRAKRYVDRISRLPDDILVDILSLLSLEEAVGTSVLSSRWMNLWKHTTCLDLDGDSALDKISRNYEIKNKFIKSLGDYREREEKIKCGGPTKYVSWVNRILQSHKAPTLKEFRIRIHFSLDIEAKKSITQWLEFAFARHVQRLELGLSVPYTNHYQYMNYKNNCFPEELLTAPSDSLCSHHPPNFKSLRALLFTGVDLTDRAIDFFLNNCPLLEKLVVRDCRTLSNVEVCGSSLVLRHLEIDSCYNMKSLKVSAPRLTYLMVLETLSNRDSSLLLENAPMLVEIDVSGTGFDIHLRHLFSTLSTRASQLEILRLVVVRLMGKTGKLPELPKLKKLLIRQVLPHPECLVRMADLITASPCLEEFVLENEWGKYFLESEDGVGSVDDAIKSPHHHLKVMKYCGYYGMATDVQLVSYILENCVALQKLIIDPSISKSGRLSIRSARYKLKHEKTGRENAKQQLEALVPRHVELVIL